MAMRAICGLAAFLILAGIAVIVPRAMREGRVFDCVEGSKTEGSWVKREDNPPKFWGLLASYIIMLGATAGMLAWTASGGAG